MRSKEVPEADIMEAGEIDWAYIRLQQRSVQAEALEEHGVDTYGASAVRGPFMPDAIGYSKGFLMSVRWLCWFPQP